MSKATQLSCHVGQELFDLCDKICEDNGWERSKVVMIGAELFLEASHDVSIAMIKRYKQRHRK